MKPAHEWPVAVVCTPGLEFVTRQEILGLGLSVPEKVIEPGVIELPADFATVAMLNHHLRSASRVLVRLDSFLAAAFSELRKKAARLPWSQFIRPGQPVTVRVTSHGSRLYHKNGIAERVAGAMADHLGQVSAWGEAGNDEDSVPESQMIVVRIVRNVCTISVDSSGAHLHRRGYRQAVAKAPLRENLAAALVLASGWTRDKPLVDPFCGSGTIPIEAALIAAGIPPGRGRLFSFMSWPIFSPVNLPAELSPASFDVGVSEVIGYDRDAGAIESARANAERTGVAGQISWEKRSISDLRLPSTPGWIVTNPPYGGRIKGGPDLRNLYARTGMIWRSLARDWHIFMLSSSPRWTAQLGMNQEVLAQFRNGGIPVAFLRVW